MKFSDFLKIYRKQKGLSIRKLANEIDVKPGVIQKCEDRGSWPTGYNCDKFLSYFHVKGICELNEAKLHELVGYELNKPVIFELGLKDCIRSLENKIAELIADNLAKEERIKQLEARV